MDPLNLLVSAPDFIPGETYTIRTESATFNAVFVKKVNDTEFKIFQYSLFRKLNGEEIALEDGSYEMIWTAKHVLNAKGGKRKHKSRRISRRRRTTRRR